MEACSGDVGMSIPEQVGKVASGTIEALKGNPGLLVLVLLQLITLGVLFFISQANRENQQAREMFLLERCFEHPGKD